LQKQIQQLEGDLDTAQTQLAEATTKLENTEKELSKVSCTVFAIILLIRAFGKRDARRACRNLGLEAKSPTRKSGVSL